MFRNTGTSTVVEYRNRFNPARQAGSM